MTSIKLFGLLGLLGWLALGLMTDACGHERPPKELLGTMSVFDGNEYFGNVIRDGDRFVVIRFRQGDGIQRPRNFDGRAVGTMKVDDKYLGYDLRGENKNLLAREEIDRDVKWKEGPWESLTLRKSEEKILVKRIQVVNGELKGWWIGLGSVEKQKEGEIAPRNRQGPRAPLILVKDKKDAAGFRYTIPEPDDGP